MNLSFREFLLPPGQGISPPSGSGNFSSLRVREFLLPPGQGIYNSGNLSYTYECLIQGISPPPGQGISPPSGSGNFSSLRVREFPIQFQGIYPIWMSHSGNFSYPIWISHPLWAGNFSSHPGRKFLIPSGQEISHSGNFSSWGNFPSPQGREFLHPTSGAGNFPSHPARNLHQGIPHTIWTLSFREFIIQGIYHSGNLSFREFIIQGIYHSWNLIIHGIYHSGNLSFREISFREFLLPWRYGISHQWIYSTPLLNFSFRAFHCNTPIRISDSGNFSD